MGAKPIRLLVLAALWIGLATAANLLSGLIFAVVARRLAPPLLPFVVPASGLVLQAVLLLGAWWSSRPPRGAGLGWRSIRRPGLLAALVPAQVVATLAWALLVISVVGVPSAEVTAKLMREAASDRWLLAALIVLATLVAPVCEDLFFRGWLWTGLCRQWGPVQTAVVTASPWLILHAADGGWRRVIMLIPAAVFFSIARHRCDSVRASIVMHVGNNAIVVAVAFLAALAGN